MRAEELCRHLKSQAHDFERPARRSVERDTGRISQFFENLDRGPTSGVAIFSSSGAGLWEEVLVPRPVKDRAAVAPHPYVMPLEALWWVEGADQEAIVAGVARGVATMADTDRAGWR